MSMHGIDLSFYYDAVITEYINNKNRYRHLTEGSNKYNVEFIFDIHKLIRLNSRTIRMFSLMRVILSDYMRENNVNLRPRINTIWNITGSLNKTNKFLRVCQDQLSKYEVPDKEVIKAFRNKIKTFKDRIDRLRSSFIPEYMELCGLNEYNDYLIENGDSIDTELEMFFQGRKTEYADINNKNLSDKERHKQLEEMYNNQAREYYEYVKRRCKDFELKVTDPSKKIAKENEIRKKRDEAIKRERKERREQQMIPVCKDVEDTYFKVIQDAFRTGRKKSLSKLKISDNQISAVSTALMAAGKTQFTMILVMSMRYENVRPALVFCKEHKGEYVKSAPYQFASSKKFITDEEIASIPEIIELLKDKYPNHYISTITINGYPENRERVMEDANGELYTISYGDTETNYDERIKFVGGYIRDTYIKMCIDTFNHFMDQDALHRSNIYFYITEYIAKLAKEYKSKFEDTKEFIPFGSYNRLLKPSSVDQYVTKCQCAAKKEDSSYSTMYMPIVLKVELNSSLMSARTHAAHKGPCSLEECYDYIKKRSTIIKRIGKPCTTVEGENVVKGLRAIFEEGIILKFDTSYDGHNSYYDSYHGNVEELHDEATIR